jgi:hypothetical protein
MNYTMKKKIMKVILVRESDLVFMKSTISEACILLCKFGSMSTTISNLNFLSFSFVLFPLFCESVNGIRVYFYSNGLSVAFSVK